MLPLLRASGRVMCPCPKTAVREVAARRERIDGKGCGWWMVRKLICVERRTSNGDRTSCPGGKIERERERERERGEVRREA
jgi:hypothetical protein